MPDALLMNSYRVSTIAVVFFTVRFIYKYSRMQPWWKSRTHIGQTIVAKDILLILAFVPAILSLFFSLSRYTSEIVGYGDVADFILIAVVMEWRTQVFEKVSKEGRRGTLPAGETDPGEDEDDESA